MISLSEAARQIMQNDVFGIQIWRYGNKFMGGLINDSGELIPNTNVWEFQITIEDVIQELEAIASRRNQ